MEVANLPIGREGRRLDSLDRWARSCGYGFAVCACQLWGSNDSDCAVQQRLHLSHGLHSDYALLASVIVAAEGATFQDVGHFAAGVAPGDGIFTTWSYRAGAGRAEAFLLNPQPLAARTAHEWGVVAEVVPSGKALSRARDLAELYLMLSKHRPGDGGAAAPCIIAGHISPGILRRAVRGRGFCTRRGGLVVDQA
jgi:hypothetical protein